MLPSLINVSLSISPRDAQAANAAPCSANFLFFSLKHDQYKKHKTNTYFWVNYQKDELYVLSSTVTIALNSLSSLKTLYFGTGNLFFPQYLSNLDFGKAGSSA